MPTGLLRLAWLLLLLLAGNATAQNFDGARFLGNCLQLEAGGDLETARESCLNALELDSTNTDTLLALARIELRLGEYGSAENRLLQLRARVATAEPALLLAELALERGDNLLANGHLDSAARQLVANPDSDLSARLDWLSGRSLEAVGELQEALGHYRRAESTRPDQADYYTAAAAVLLRMGLPDAAAEELLQYQLATGEQGDADLHALLGRAQWAAGRLGVAASEFETAYSLRAGRNAEAQAGDLRSLTAIYYGMGDLASGNAALRDSLGRGNLVRLLTGNPLMWLLVLLLVAAAHLLSESRILQDRTVELTDGPRQWSVSRVYNVLFLSLLLAALAAVAYSHFVLDNWLAAVTPLQSGQVREVFLIVFSVSAAVSSWVSARSHGWAPGQVLLGRADHVAGGVVLGLVLAAAVVAWKMFLPDGVLQGAWQLDLSRIRGLTVAAAILLPLSELFFRSFAFPALDKRYSGGAALAVTSGLYALVLGTPVLLSLALGAALGVAFRSTRSGLLAVVAQLVLQLGLVFLNMAWSGAATLFS